MRMQLNGIQKHSDLKETWWMSFSNMIQKMNKTENELECKSSSITLTTWLLNSKMNLMNSSLNQKKLLSNLENTILIKWSSTHTTGNMNFLLELLRSSKRSNWLLNKEKMPKFKKFRSNQMSINWSLNLKEFYKINRNNLTWRKKRRTLSDRIKQRRNESYSKSRKQRKLLKDSSRFSNKNKTLWNSMFIGELWTLDSIKETRMQTLL